MNRLLRKIVSPYPRIYPSLDLGLLLYPNTWIYLCGFTAFSRKQGFLHFLCLRLLVQTSMGENRAPTKTSVVGTQEVSQTCQRKPIGSLHIENMNQSHSECIFDENRKRFFLSCSIRSSLDTCAEQNLYQIHFD